MRYVYLISDGELTKIGFSNNPEQRLKGFKVVNQNLKLICKGTGYSESELHGIFADKRIRGEWFNLSESDIIHAVRLITSQLLHNNESLSCCTSINLPPALPDSEDIKLLGIYKTYTDYLKTQHGGSQLSDQIGNKALAVMRDVENNPDKYPKTFEYIREGQRDMYMSL